MTPLPDPDPAARTTVPRAILLVVILAGASLAGCIGDEDDGDDPASTESFKLFLAALGDQDAIARLDAATVSLENATSTRQLNNRNPTVDLGQLAAQSQAQLVATGPGLSGTAEETVLVFDYLTVGSTNITGARLELPAVYPVASDVEATLTIDLDATAERGEATVANLVIEQAGQRVETFTRSDLEGTDPEPIPELPTPTIQTTTGDNDTAPSFEVNADINFTYELPPSDATVENVFWSFGDGSTTTGPSVTHAYRTPGFYAVRVILEGDQGQQATANTTLEAYFRTDGEGNVGIGTGGQGAIEGRDSKNHTIDIPGNFTSVTVRVEQSPSGGLCQGGECAPSNVHVELSNPEGELLARNSSGNAVKWLNVTGLMRGGTWELTIKGDQGAAVGYTYMLEAHYLGLCASAGGLPGFDCPAEPDPVSGDGGGTLP